jgi:hypothetical protein
MTSNEQKPKVGDIVLVKQGIGVVRFVGRVEEFDDDEESELEDIGIEIKGNAVIGGSDGTWNNKKYFTCRPNRGIFVKKIIRIVSSEELLHKVGELYDILKGRNSHFIDRNSYDQLLNENNNLKQQNESLQELINMLKIDFHSKIYENANLQNKIFNAEQKIGTRLSLINNQNLINDLNNIGPNFEQISKDIDINHNNNNNKRDSIVLDNLNDNNNNYNHETSSQVIPLKTKGKGFNIDENVNIPNSNAFHYRKISQSTKQVINQNKSSNINNNNQDLRQNKSHKEEEDEEQQEQEEEEDEHNDGEQQHNNNNNNNNNNNKSRDSIKHVKNTMSIDSQSSQYRYLMGVD